jgi:hypothetical protein
VDVADLASKITQTIAAFALGACWGVRVDFGIAYQPGDTTAPSRVWRDGEPLEELLDGTSALDVRHGAAWVAQQMITGYLPSMRHTCEGEPTIVLLRADWAYPGEDPGEIVMRNAEVVRVWYVSRANPSSSKDVDMYEIHGSTGILTTARDIRRARKLCDSAMLTDPKARVMKDGDVVYDPRAPRAARRDPTVDAVEFLMRHAENRPLSMSGMPGIAVRPVVSGRAVMWWASIDVLTPTGSVEWWGASKGAKTPEGAFRQLVREVIEERSR